MPARIPSEELLDDLREFNDETGSLEQNLYDEDKNRFDSLTQSRRFGSFGNAVDAAGIPHDFVECPECGNLYDALSNHWRYNPKHRPEVTDRQHEILTGLLMGDAWMFRYNKNSKFGCAMITPGFLKWVDDELGPLGCGVSFSKSAEYIAESLKKSGFRINAKIENCHDQFFWSSRAHPEFNRYDGWYDEEDGKRYPDDLELTSVVFSVWFCTDGTVNWGDHGRPRLVICCSNESDREDYLRNLFSGLPVTPLFWEKRDGDGLDIAFNQDDSEWLWNWMEGPLPGFEYKWPTDEDFEKDDVFWTEEEVNILKEEYEKEGSLISNLDRSRRGIIHKANKIGISYEGD